MNQSNYIKWRNFANGRVLCFFFYFVACIIAIVEGYVRKDVNNIAHTCLTVYLVASLVTLFLLKPGRAVLEKTYEKVQCIFFLMLASDMCYIFHSINVLLFIFFVQSVLALVFLDNAIYTFQAVVMAFFIAVLGVLGILGLDIEPISSEHIFGIIVIFAVQWICSNIINLFNNQTRHMLEQERSLDDTLRLLEVKCTEARQATKSKSDFLSSMSHEIRTPINSILGMNEMILRENRDENIQEYANNINSSGRILLSLLNDILDYSKIETNKMGILPAPYQMSSLLNDLVNSVRVQAKKKGLGLALDIDPNIPRSLYGDDVRINQIILNLLTNAVKYTPEGTVTLKLTSRTINEFRVMLHCEVIDTGIGIKKEDIPKISIAFQRFEERKNRSIMGTGLGLNIVTNLLNLMGSELVVESEYGKGSVFSFDLQQDIVENEPIGNIQDSLQTVETEYHYRASLYAPEAKVLVVDDNEVNRKVLSHLLKKTGIRLTEAQSGEECLDFVRTQRFDAILLDHMMPGMDGIETLHHIREEDNMCREIPVVALTANAVSGAREMYLSEGFDEFLTKPVNSGKLEALLINLLPNSLLMELPEESRPEKEDGGEDAGEEIELPMIDGIDWEYARVHFTDDEILLQSLKDFYRMADHEADTLEELYRRIPEEGTKEYQITVHGMKSVAGLIGAFPLSGCAKILEKAAADGDLDRIDRLTPILLQEWRQYKEKLAELVGESGDKETEKTEQRDDSVVLALLNMLAGAASDMDVDAMDESMEELKKYDVPDGWEKDMGDLEVAVMNLDVDAITRITDYLMESIQNILEVNEA